MPRLLTITKAYPLLHPMKEKNYEFLKNLATSRGADLFGVADTTRIEKYIYEELKSQTDKMPYTVSIGIRLQRSVLNTIIDRPNQIYKTHYRHVNAQLDGITSFMAGEIQRNGYNAIPIAASYIIDWKLQNAHVSHRHVGLEAGLGFWGKNNILIHPEYGAGIRLTSLFTDMPLTIDSPIENDCGDSAACMAACPAEAISDDGFEFDKCYQMVRQFSKQDNYNVMICGLCVRACADARSKT
jgi:epoxyqueuosine reductase